MALLLLIRHGRTAANADGVLAGRLPGVVLDDEGKRSVQALSQRLEPVNVATVVTSPLERTVETAQLLFGRAITPVVDDRLVECDYGSWSGRKLSELSQEPLWQQVQGTPDTVTFPEGETMSDMYQRAVSCVGDWDRQVEAEYGADAIWAAVSHGDVIKAICAHALGVPLRGFQRIMVEPASVSVIRFKDGQSSVVKINDSGDSWIGSLSQRLPESTVGGQAGT